MIPFLVATSAYAADLAAFAGDWGVDPARSDDAAVAVGAAPAGVTFGGGEAAALAPDGQGDGQESVDKARERMVIEVLGLLGSSGRIELRPDGAALAVTLAGESPLRLEPDGGWARVSCQDAKCRVRVREQGDRLVLERRMRSTRVVETLLPPEEGGTLMVAVVHIESAAVAHAIEFRRVYRALSP